MSRDNNNKVTISLNPEKTHHRYSSILSEQEIMSPFHIVEWNGSPGLKEWGYDNSSDSIPKKCLLVEGALEGTIFPRSLKTTRDLKLFRSAFCRPVILEFLKEGYSPLGFKSYYYTVKKNMFDSPEQNPDNICYCHNGECPGKGLQSIAACYYDMPVILSLPHFLNSDSDVINQIEGVSPAEEIHKSLGVVHPDFGIPLDGSSLKIQVNLEVAHTKYNTRTKPFNGLMLPLFWIELGCSDLPDFVKVLLTILEIAPTAQSVVMYLLGLIGLSMISGATLLILFFSKTIAPRHLSIAQEYSPLPIININSEYLTKEIRISKQSLVPS